MEEKTIYYHGGNDDIRMGEYIMPASHTGKHSCEDWARRYKLEGADLCDKTRCYVTTSLQAALVFACAQEKPMIYIVEPEDMKHDPDCTELGLSYSCSRAKVIGKQRPVKSIVKAVRAGLIKMALSERSKR